MIIGPVMATAAVGRPKKNVREIFGTKRLPGIYWIENDMHSRKSFGPDPGCRVRGLYFGNARLLFSS